MKHQEANQQATQELPVGYCLLIEDNIIDQAQIKLIMDSLGYSTIITVDSLKSSAYFLTKRLPDVIIISFHLKDGTNGVDILNFPGIYQSKLIFVTDNPNEDIYKSVQGKPNIGFLTKPLNLYITKNTINLLDLIDRDIRQKQARKYLKVRDKDKVVLLDYDEIVWLEADGNYTYINTTIQKYIIKNSLLGMLRRLDDRFAQTHRGYAVNINFVKDINTIELKIGNSSIPISDTYRLSFINRLSLLPVTDPLVNL